MFKKILLGTDLKTNSELLVAWIAKMKKLGLEEVVLAHVSDLADSPEGGNLKEDARAAFGRQEAALQAEGFRITADLPAGMPAPALAATAEEHDVSLVVVGSHGRGLLGEALFGTVGKLLHLSRRPVLVFPANVLEGPKEELCPDVFAKVLVATDFSETAERITPYAAKMSGEFGSKLTLLHILDEKGGRPAPEAEKQFLIEAKRERLQRQGAGDISIGLRPGSPGREICRMAAEGNFSLVVMGGTRTAIAREMVLGSTVSGVIRHSTVPVMIIPPEQ